MHKTGCPFASISAYVNICICYNSRQAGAYVPRKLGELFHVKLCSGMYRYARLGAIGVIDMYVVSEHTMYCIVVYR